MMASLPAVGKSSTAGAQVTPQLPESTSASLLLQLTCYYAMQSDNAELFVKAVLELAHNDQVQLQSMLQGLMTEYEVSDAPQINLPVKSVPASTEKGRALGPQLGSSARIAHHELESLLAGEAEAVAAAQNAQRALEDCQSELAASKQQAGRVPAFEQEVATLQDELDTLRGIQREFDRSAAENVQLRARLETMTGTLEATSRLEQQHQALLKKCMAAEKIAETVPELKQRIEAYRTKCTDSEVALVERAAEIKDLQAEIAKLQSDCAQLRRRLSEHEARGDTQVDSSNDEMFGIAEGLSEFNPELVERLARLEEENTALKGSVDQATLERVQQQQHELEDMRQLKDSLEGKYTSTTKELAATTSTLQQTQGDLKGAYEQVAQLNEEVAQMGRELGDMTEAYNAMQARATDLEDHVSRLEETLRASEEAAERMETDLRDQLSGLQADLDSERTTWVAETEELQQIHARELKELEEQTQEQVDEMQAILETQQRTAADERTLDRTKYSENKQKLQEKLKEQQKRIAAGTRYVRELEQSLTDKSTTISELRSELEVSKQAATRAQTECRRLKQQITKLQGELADAQQADAGSDGRVVELTGDIERLQKTVRALQQDNDRMRTQGYLPSSMNLAPATAVAPPTTPGAEVNTNGAGHESGLDESQAHVGGARRVGVANSTVHAGMAAAAHTTSSSTSQVLLEHVRRLEAEKTRLSRQLHTSNLRVSEELRAKNNLENQLQQLTDRLSQQEAVVTKLKLALNRRTLLPASPQRRVTRASARNREAGPTTVTPSMDTKAKGDVPQPANTPLQEVQKAVVEPLVDSDADDTVGDAGLQFESGTTASAHLQLRAINAPAPVTRATKRKSVYARGRGATRQKVDGAGGVL